MSRNYSRKTTCNELIDAEQRELVIELFTETRLTYHHMSQKTGVPIAKIKNMTAGMSRPVSSPPLTTMERTALLARW